MKQVWCRRWTSFAHSSHQGKKGRTMGGTCWSNTFSKGHCKLQSFDVSFCWADIVHCSSGTDQEIRFGWIEWRIRWIWSIQVAVITKYSWNNLCYHLQKWNVPEGDLEVCGENTMIETGSESLKKGGPKALCVGFISSNERCDSELPYYWHQKSGINLRQAAIVRYFSESFPYSPDPRHYGSGFRSWCVEIRETPADMHLLPCCARKVLTGHLK